MLTSLKIITLLSLAFVVSMLTSHLVVDAISAEIQSMERPDISCGDPSRPVCGIKECHGYDIHCTRNPPDICTTIYELGDLCRQFLPAGNVACHHFQFGHEQSCQMDILSIDVKFFECANCFETCLSDQPPDPWTCEEKCQHQLGLSASS